jgi:sugar lactone lactonase YvrE
VQLNSKGDIYALDSKERRIVRLSPEGEFKAVLKAEGAPPPGTIVVKSFVIDSADNVYVLDVFSARVLVLDAAGKFVRSLALPGDIGFASDVAVDESGAVLVLDAIKRRLFSAAKGAEAFTQVGGDLKDAVATLPTFLATSKGAIFVAEGSGGRIVILRRDGTFGGRALTPGQEEGSLSQPAQMCVNDKDEVFIADRDNSRVQVFQLIR